MILTLITYAFLSLGALALLIASIGIYTMPDLLCKIHAATKATTVGILCLAIAYACEAQSISATLLSSAIVLFLFLTVPVASHVISTRYLDIEESK